MYGTTTTWHDRSRASRAKHGEPPARWHDCTDPSNEKDIMTTPWPTPDEYTLAHRCARCGAEPGVRCVSQNARTVEFGHARRQDAGIRHHRRDVGNAPWIEDRVPGVSYDTITTNGED